MMKKITIITLLLFSTLSFSQKKFGVFGGLNNSTISEGILKEITIEDKMGFHFGGFYEFQISEKIAFRPKIVYSQQGNLYNNISYVEFVDLKFEYLNIPLNLKFYDKTYILVGPQVGFLISEKKTNFWYDSPDSNQANKIDLGLNLGFGQKINDFFVEINFYQGFTKVVDRKSVTGGTKKGTNTLIQLSLGYYIL